MLMDIQGSRYDGQPWPGYKGLIDVPEWEAEKLVGAFNAEYPDAPDLDRGFDVLKAPDPDFESNLRRLDGTEAPEEVEEAVIADDYDSDFDRDDSDNDTEPEAPEFKKPYATASKADWIAYARSKGETQADAMTKAQLVAKFS
jgi:hypothetical protein